MRISDTQLVRTKLAAVDGLNRKIYASLPWGFRVAQVMVRLSYSLTETVGRVFYSLFLRSGVEGMPAGPQPGTKPERLPKGYGSEFGKKLYAFILKKTGNPDKAETVIGEMMLSVAKGKFKIAEGYRLQQAESYVFQAATRHISDVIREERGRKDRGTYREPAINDSIDDLNLSDPNAFRELDGMISHRDLNDILEELEDIDPRAPSWLEAQLNGVLNVELAAMWGVTEPRISQWERSNLPKIKKVIEQYVN